jgi:hypothetical protein
MVHTVLKTIHKETTVTKYSSSPILLGFKINEYEIKGNAKTKIINKESIT